MGIEPSGTVYMWLWSALAIYVAACWCFVWRSIDAARDVPRPRTTTSLALGWRRVPGGRPLVPRGAHMCHACMQWRRARARPRPATATVQPRVKDARAVIVVVMRRPDERIEGMHAWF